MFVKKKYEAKKARKSKVDWYNLAYWVSKANEPEYGDMSITLKEIADHAHTTVDDVKAHAYDMMKTMRGIDSIEDVYWRGDVDSPITFTKKKMWYEGRRANEARMLQGNNYSYHRDFAGKSGSIGDLRLYDDGKMTFTSYNSKTYPSVTWKFKDLDTAKAFYSALDYKLLDLSYGNVSDEEFADYLSRKMSDLRQKYDLLKEKCLADGKSESDYGAFDWTVGVSYLENGTGEAVKDVYLIKAHNMNSAKEQAILRANRKGSDAHVYSCKLGKHIYGEAKKPTGY